MTVYGITDTGFTLKRLADIIQDIGTVLSDVQDPVSGEYLTLNLLDENDPFILLINAISDSLSVLWEQAQLAYNQFDLSKATGAGLSGTVQLNNITRSLGDYATTNCALTGTANKYMAAGILISDMADLHTFALPAFTFDSSGEATAIATCTVKGPVVALTGTLVKILTPTSGLSSVTNSDDSDGGEDDETDAELRARQQLSTANSARSIIDSVYGKLTGIAGVTHVKIFQNRTLTTDARGIPPKSAAVVIIGGSDPYISQAIFQSLDCDTYGTTYSEQIDEQGIVYPVYFSRPEDVDVYVAIEIEIVDATLWPSDGEDKIKEYVLAWALSGAAGIGITEDYGRGGYLPGDTVYASELFTPVHNQLGIRIVSINVGTVSPATDQQVDTAWNEIAAFSSARIEISYFGESS